MNADEKRVQEIAASYYDGEISFEQLEAHVGSEKAANFRVLKRQLDEEFVEEVAELETFTRGEDWGDEAFRDAGDATFGNR